MASPDAVLRAARAARSAYQAKPDLPGALGAGYTAGKESLDDSATRAKELAEVREYQRRSAIDHNQTEKGRSIAARAAAAPREAPHDPDTQDIPWHTVDPRLRPHDPDTEDVQWATDDTKKPTSPEQLRFKQPQAGSVPTERVPPSIGNTAAVKRAFKGRSYEGE